MSGLSFSYDRVVLLGLDGATHELIDQFIEEGKLPVFASLKKEGAYGDLDSTIPPTTPPAWASCITGVNPGKHGIFDFRESPLQNPDQPLIHSKSIRSKRLWHTLNDNGLKTGIFNVPITYPPEELDGFMISGMMTPSVHSQFAYPNKLKEEILSCFPDYEINVDVPQFETAYEEDANFFIEKVTHNFRVQAKTFIYLLNKTGYHFYMPVFVLPDRLSHLLWKFMDRRYSHSQSFMGQRIRNKVITAFQEMDRFIGDLISQAPNRFLLLIVSDHGFGGTDGYFNVNRWLMDQGFLSLKLRPKIQKRLFFYSWKASELPLIQSIIPQTFARRIKKIIRNRRNSFQNELLDSVQYHRSKAFFNSIPCQGIYANETLLPKHDMQSFLLEIKYRLNQIKYFDGSQLIDSINFRDELYSGSFQNHAPHILLVAKNYSVLGRQHLGALNWIDDYRHQPNGFHRSNGILFAYGHGIASSKHIQKASIIDITPTVLSAFGLKVPAYIDGKNLEDLWMQTA